MRMAPRVGCPSQWCRVEDRRGGLGHVATLRFLSSLIKPDVPISGIRLSDQLHREAHGEKLWPQASSARRLFFFFFFFLFLRLTIQLSLKGPGLFRCCKAHRQSPSPHHLRKRAGSQGPFLRRRYPASTVIRPCPTPVQAAAC